MKYQNYFFIMFLLLVFGCKQKESEIKSEPGVNIQLPSTSAKVVFHIKDNKVTSYELLNEDGSPFKEGVVYRSVNATGENTCYSCPEGVTDLSKCTKIPCPPDPCKDIYCGPLKFQVNDMAAPEPKPGLQFTIVANGMSK